MKNSAKMQPPADSPFDPVTTTTTTDIPQAFLPVEVLPPPPPVQPSAPPPAPREKVSLVDGELAAMAKIVKILTSLDYVARIRVMAWTMGKFYPDAVVMSQEAVKNFRESMVGS